MFTSRTILPILHRLYFLSCSTCSTCSTRCVPRPYSSFNLRGSLTSRDSTPLTQRSRGPCRESPPCSSSEASYRSHSHIGKKRFASSPVSRCPHPSYEPTSPLCTTHPSLTAGKTGLTAELKKANSNAEVVRAQLEMQLRLKSPLGKVNAINWLSSNGRKESISFLGGGVTSLTPPRATSSFREDIPKPHRRSAPS